MYSRNSMVIRVRIQIDYIITMHRMFNACLTNIRPNTQASIVIEASREWRRDRRLFCPFCRLDLMKWASTVVLCSSRNTISMIMFMQIFELWGHYDKQRGRSNSMLLNISVENDVAIFVGEICRNTHHSCSQQKSNSKGEINHGLNGRDWMRCIRISTADIHDPNCTYHPTNPHDIRQMNIT